MPDTSGDSQPQPVATRASWSSAGALEQIFVDEMVLQNVRGTFYLTFGQVRMPLFNLPDAEAEIQPMVRLIISDEAMQRVAAVFRRSVSSSAETEQQ